MLLFLPNFLYIQMDTLLQHFGDSKKEMLRSAIPYVSQCHCTVVGFGCEWHSVKIIFSNIFFLL